MVVRTLASRRGELLHTKRVLLQKRPIKRDPPKETYQKRERPTTKETYQKRPIKRDPPNETYRIPKETCCVSKEIYYKTKLLRTKRELLHTTRVLLQKRPTKRSLLQKRPTNLKARRGGAARSLVGAEICTRTYMGFSLSFDGSLLQ